MSMEGLSWENARDFAHSVRERTGASALELAEALLWYRYRCAQRPEGMNVMELAQLLDSFGLANKREALVELGGRHPLTSSLYLDPEKGGYVARYERLRDLDAKYQKLVGAPPRPPIMKHLIDPVEIDDNSPFRKVFSALVEEINVCYVTQLPNACAVLCRRLIEVLLIKSLKAHGQLEQVLDSSNKDVVIGLGAIIGKAKSGNCGFRLHKDTKELLDEVYRAGNDGAHSDFYALKIKDIDEFAPLMDKGITDLLNQAKIALK
jgi:Domain of unknown function (DUF4145)